MIATKLTMQRPHRLSKFPYVTLNGNPRFIRITGLAASICGGPTIEFTNFQQKYVFIGDESF